jgi:hypothetical protein
VFVPRLWHLNPEAEKHEYDLHQNDINDSGYREFLRRAYDPIAQHVKKPASGLDFGCGPGPALYAMFCEAGYTMKKFDHFYDNDPSVFDHRFDFITLTEVIEHLREPMAELKRLVAVLNSPGWLLIMTKRVLSREKFEHWHYKNDPTHITFYSMQTFDWLSGEFGLTISEVGKDTVLLHKK